MADLKLNSEIHHLRTRIAELAAENERLKLECAEYREIAARKSNQVAGIIRAEAISRTGAVKELEWSEYETDGWADRADAEAGSFGVFYNIDIQPDGYRVVFDHEAVGAIGTFDTADEAKAAAQADYERRILSALEPHPRATSTVDAHETANVRDKPEGQQEPVAFVCCGCGRFETDPKEDIKRLRMAGHVSCCPERDMLPLYTRPSEQAVTEAMVEAGLRAAEEAASKFIFDGEIAFADGFSDDFKERFRTIHRAALKAAMEAGG